LCAEQGCPKVPPVIVGSRSPRRPMSKPEGFDSNRGRDTTEPDTGAASLRNLVGSALRRVRRRTRNMSQIMLRDLLAGGRPEAFERRSVGEWPEPGGHQRREALSRITAKARRGGGRSTGAAGGDLACTPAGRGQYGPNTGGRDDPWMTVTPLSLVGHTQPNTGGVRCLVTVQDVAVR